MAELKRAYESGELSDRQQKDINNARVRAVNQFWRKEQEYVNEGKGTRDWTPKQQEDLLKNGSVQGFEGHHMRSVSNGKTYEEQMEIAGDVKNIQALEKTQENNEHILAHGGNTRNRTNGYYDVETGKTKDFGDRAPIAPRAEQLSEPIVKQLEKGKEEGHTDRFGVDLGNADSHQRELEQQKKEQSQLDRFGVDLSKADSHQNSYAQQEQNREQGRTR